MSDIFVTIVLIYTAGIKYISHPYFYSILPVSYIFLIHSSTLYWWCQIYSSCIVLLYTSGVRYICQHSSTLYCQCQIYLSPYFWSILPVGDIFVTHSSTTYCQCQIYFSSIAGFPPGEVRTPPPTQPQRGDIPPPLVGKENTNIVHILLSFQLKKAILGTKNWKIWGCFPDPPPILDPPPSYQTFLAETLHSSTLYCQSHIYLSPLYCRCQIYLSSIVLLSTASVRCINHRSSLLYCRCHIYSPCTYC